MRAPAACRREDLSPAMNDAIGEFITPVWVGGPVPDRAASWWLKRAIRVSYDERLLLHAAVLWLTLRLQLELQDPYPERLGHLASYTTTRPIRKSIRGKWTLGRSGTRSFRHPTLPSTPPSSLSLLQFHPR